MARRFAVLSKIFCLALAGLAACSAPARVQRTACEPSSLSSCVARCGSGTASRDTHEGGCEGVLHDLCRAHCDEDCHGSSAVDADRIGALEARLDHECGSGRPAAPEKTPRATPMPTPNALDRLLL
jgi:hypothetical protein